MQQICRVPEALGKSTKPLGKEFAERGSRQRPLGKFSVGKGGFAESPFSGARQTICREQTGPSAKKRILPVGCVAVTAPLPRT
jgi:hypothetical protein